MLTGMFFCPVVVFLKYFVYEVVLFLLAKGGWFLLSFYEVVKAHVTLGIFAHNIAIKRY